MEFWAGWGSDGNWHDFAVMSQRSILVISVDANELIQSKYVCLQERQESSCPWFVTLVSLQSRSELPLSRMFTAPSNHALMAWRVEHRWKH